MQSSHVETAARAKIMERIKDLELFRTRLGIERMCLVSGNCEGVAKQMPRKRTHLSPVFNVQISHNHHKCTFYSVYTDLLLKSHLRFKAQLALPCVPSLSTLIYIVEHMTENEFKSPYPLP